MAETNNAEVNWFKPTDRDKLSIVFKIISQYVWKRKSANEAVKEIVNHFNEWEDTY